MHRAFHPDNLMAILDGIDDAVVKLEWTGEFHCHEANYRRLWLVPSKHEREIRLGIASGTGRQSRWK